MAVTDDLLVPGALRDDPVEHLALTDRDLGLLREYETQFLRDKQIAEKLYCDKCFAANLHDGCRVEIGTGLVSTARIQCRCRVLESHRVI